MPPSIAPIDPTFADKSEQFKLHRITMLLPAVQDLSSSAFLVRLLVVHHVRKSISRDEIGRAFRGSSALHAVGDSYLLLTRSSAHRPALELRFQFRYAAPPPPRLLALDAHTLWFSPAGPAPAPSAPRRKVDPQDVTQALTSLGQQARYSQLREQIMQRTECSKRTAQLAISEACQQGWIVPHNGHYRLSA